MKKFSKIISALLSVSVLAGMVQIPAMAAESYDPTHLFVTESANAINISWRNPSGTLTDVVLYDEAGAVIKEDFSIASKALCSHSFTGLTSGAEKRVKLVFSYAGGENEIVLEGKATGEAEILTPFEGWKLRSDFNSTDKHEPIRVTAGEDKDGGSGYSLHVTSNSTLASTGSYYPAIRIMPTSGEFDVTKKYRIEFDRRRAICKNKQFTVTYRSDAEGPQIAWDTTELGNWAHTSEDFTVVNASSEDKRIGNKFFMFTANTGDMSDYWIDNIVIKELDASGNPIGENLVANGGFDTLVSAPAALSAEAAPADGGAVISWNAPADADKVNVYQKAAGGSLSLKASVNAFSESVELSGLTNDTEYTYVIKAENLSGVEGEGVEKTVTPQEGIEPSVNEAEYLPKSLVVRPGNAHIGFSFTTPSAQTFEGVSVYDKEGTLLSENLATTASQRGDYSQSGLENGLIYNYKLVFSFSDNDDEVLYVSAKAGYDERTVFASWKRLPNDQSSYTPIDITADTGRGTSGNSLLIKYPQTNEHILVANQGQELTAGKKYKLSFYKKAENANTLWFRAGASNSYQVAWNNSNYPLWQQVEETFTLNAPSTVGTVVLSTSAGTSTDSFWLDDIRLVEVSETGEELTGNLVVNGDFETLAEPDIPTLTINASVENGIATVNWTSLNAERVDIYEKKSSGSKKLKGSYAADANTAVIEGILDGSDIVAIATNYSGVEGRETAVSSGADTPSSSTDKTSEASYNPTNVIVRGDKSKISVSWRNPETANLTAVSLIDIDNDIEMGTYEAEAGKMYCEKFNGVSLNDIRNCVLRFEYSDSVALEIPIEAKAEPNSDSPFADWSVVYAGDTLTHVPVSITADSEVKRSGAYSAHIQSNNKTENSSVKLVLTVNEDIDYTGNTEYVSTMYVKSGKAESTTAASAAFALDGGSDYFDNRLGLAWNGSEYSTWTERKQTIKPKDSLSSGAAVIFIENVAIADLWIDDVSIQKVNEDGTLGDNLVKNGGFDTLAVTAVPTDVTGAEALAAESSAKLSWTKGEDAKAVKIYKKNADGTLALRAIASDSEAVTLNNLTNNVEYTFVIKAVSAAGMESAGVEVKVTPKEPIIKTTEINLFSGSTQVYQLSAGSFTAKTTVTNNDKVNPIDAVLIAGLFKDGAMIDVEWLSAKVEPGTPEPLEVPMNVPAYEGNTCPYTLKVFLWDKVDAMFPYIDAVNF